MAWTNIIAPIQPNTDRYAPAYAGLLWQWKDATPITGTTNNGGFLEVAVNATEGARPAIGDYVYLNILEHAAEVETPFAQVNGLSTGYIKVNVPYSASYTAETPEVRFIFNKNFIIETGYGVYGSTSIQTILNLKPNKEAYYEVDTKSACISRFVFKEPAPTSDLFESFNHSIRHYAYPDTESVAACIALKQVSGYNNDFPSIFYNGIQNICTKRDGDKYAVGYTKNGATTNITAGSTTTIHTYVGDSINITFGTNLSDLTLNPVTNPTGVTFTSISSGQILTGLTGTITQAAGYDQTLEYDDGTTVYNIRFIVHAVLDLRDRCAGKSLMLVWWDRLAGWKQYSFENRKVYALEGTKSEIVGGENNQFVSSYLESLEEVELFARPESEAVLDYLNRMLLATEIFEVVYDSSGNIDSYRRMFNPSPKGQLKEKPFSSPRNIFSVKLNYSEEVLTTNQD